VSDLEALNAAFQDEIEEKNEVIRELCEKFCLKTQGIVRNHDLLTQCRGMTFWRDIEEQKINSKIY
jgi:hypothetical protein